MGSYQNLTSCKRVVPGLSIAVQSTMAKDLDVLSSPNPEGNRLLERVVEVVRLPVLDVVGELGKVSQTMTSSFSRHMLLTLISPSN